tara:strand:- start:2747 stop:5098 length:2352 start_codon:yes stop_codon:yes gene_type:complete
MSSVNTNGYGFLNVGSDDNSNLTSLIKGKDSYNAQGYINNEILSKNASVLNEDPLLQKSNDRWNEVHVPMIKEIAAMPEGDAKEEALAVYYTYFSDHINSTNLELIRGTGDNIYKWIDKYDVNEFSKNERKSRNAALTNVINSWQLGYENPVISPTIDEDPILVGGEPPIVGGKFIIDNTIKQKVEQGGNYLYEKITGKKPTEDKADVVQYFSRTHSALPESNFNFLIDNSVFNDLFGSDLLSTYTGNNQREKMAQLVSDMNNPMSFTLNELSSLNDINPAGMFILNSSLLAKRIDETDNFDWEQLLPALGNLRDEIVPEIGVGVGVVEGLKKVGKKYTLPLVVLNRISKIRNQINRTSVGRKFLLGSRAFGLTKVNQGQKYYNRNNLMRTTYQNSLETAIGSYALKFANLDEDGVFTKEEAVDLANLEIVLAGGGTLLLGGAAKLFSRIKNPAKNLINTANKTTVGDFKNLSYGDVKRFKFFYEQVDAVGKGALKRPLTKFEKQFLEEGRTAYAIISAAEESVGKLKNKLDLGDAEVIAKYIRDNKELLEMSQEVLGARTKLKIDYDKVFNSDDFTKALLTRWNQVYGDLLNPSQKIANKLAQEHALLKNQNVRTWAKTAAEADSYINQAVQLDGKGRVIGVNQELIEEYLVASRSLTKEGAAKHVAAKVLISEDFNLLLSRIDDVIYMRNITEGEDFINRLLPEEEITRLTKNLTEWEEATSEIGRRLNELKITDRAKYKTWKKTYTDKALKVNPEELAKEIRTVLNKYRGMKIKNGKVSC